jgi:hypothetical protein
MVPLLSVLNQAPLTIPSVGLPSPAAGLMRASGSFSHYPTDSGDFSSRVHSRGWHESLAAGRAAQVQTQLQWLTMLVITM